ncbi:hypothetical protein FEM48_Zijuj09G0148700 [Ziziphus jujuba var. spinosa]|uniref:Pentatricopeptide repeat-containing protein n=1 Tax=Ziziphus jujuba var. spinosa TaxID=714518 RepID=A0A978UTM3_ZIZJJ|nr:hypothetical protein FEM48_Zijuj09G0148700 [Ziziphus jujuba var. spinosa]
MASSLPSVAVNGTLKLDSDFRKQPSSFLPTDKSSNVSYQRSYVATHLDGTSEPKSLDFREALCMMKENSTVESTYYVSLLQECIDKNSAAEAQMVHAHIIKTGSHGDLFVSTFLVNVYVKCGTMENARKVFDNLPSRNVVAWTTLMTGYVHNLKPELAIQVFLEMLKAGTYPTNYTLGIALNACTSLHSIKVGEQIHAYIIKYRIDFDTSIGNSLCTLYAKCRDLESSVKAFMKIREKNVISWTGIISACGDNGEAARGLQFFTEMLSEDVEPNEFTLTSVLSLCCVMLTLGVGTQVKEAQTLFEGMETVSLITWNAMIAGYAQMMDLEGNDLSAYQMMSSLRCIAKHPAISLIESSTTLNELKQIHTQLLVNSLLNDNHLLGQFVASIALHNPNNLYYSNHVLSQCPNPTLFTFNSMIRAYSKSSTPHKSFHFFKRILRSDDNLSPDNYTFNFLVRTCAQLSARETGPSVHCAVVKHGFENDPHIQSGLIFMYAELGWLSSCHQVFDPLKPGPSKELQETVKTLPAFPLCP